MLSSETGRLRCCEFSSAAVFEEDLVHLLTRESIFQQSRSSRCR